MYSLNLAELPYIECLAMALHYIMHGFICICVSSTVKSEQPDGLPQISHEPVHFITDWYP